jgi:predicted N-acetyltransferase YhbS
MLIRPAQLDDVPLLSEIEQSAWPKGMASTADEIRSRVELFPTGQLVAEIGGKVVAFATAQRVRQAFFTANQSTFPAVTDHGRIVGSHADDGDIYHLIGVCVLHSHQGFGLARVLIDRQIEIARSLPGIRRILGVTRPARYHKRSTLSIEQYVVLRSASGRLIDPVLAFHLDYGARLVTTLPGFRPEDHDSLGYGVLIEYPVHVESAHKRT